MPPGVVAEMAVHTLGLSWVIWAKANFGSDAEWPDCGLGRKESLHCHLVFQTHIASLLHNPTISSQTPKDLKLGVSSLPRRLPACSQFQPPALAPPCNVRSHLQLPA